MADTGQTAHSGQSISVTVDGSNIQITLHGQGHGQSRAVGWGAVEDAVRADDERQVQSCKEDIDSLLTFAGLYSAALTALLALSFGMLQEDTAGESLLVLRQIALQTAAYQLLPGGGLNTTAAIPPPFSSPFEPSRVALRVNILWFASLVFSLSTASIGILVKQWLRAYTSYRTSSAQGRMRVRYFRHQGMEIWKVYEIAALLPFFIQLALGLFFVGLCYFTAGVHSDLGHATLPLVAGWALFIIVVTILPIFSSHCPYKPAMFEGLFSVIRPRLFSFMEASCILLYLLVKGPLSDLEEVFISAYAKMFSTLALWWTAVNGITKTLVTHVCRLAGENGALLGRLSQGMLSSIKVASASARAKVFSSLALAWTAVNQISKTLGPHIDRLSLETPPESDLKQHILGRLALQARKRTSLCAHSDRPCDETDAVKFGGKDAEVLVFADTMQSDDDLLGTAIADAMKQSQHTVENIAAFVVGVLRSRDITELSVEDEPPTTWLDCRSFTPRVVAAVADVMAHHHSLIRYDSPPRACCWLYLTLLSLPRPLPAGGLLQDMLTLYDEAYIVSSFNIQDMLERSSKPLVQSLRLVLSAYKLFWISKYLSSDSMRKSSSAASSCVAHVLQATLTYAGLSNVTLSEGYADGSLERCMTFSDFPLQDTIEWLAELVRQEVELTPEEIHAPTMRDTLELVFRLSRLDFISRSSQRAIPRWDFHASLVRGCSEYCIENSIAGLQWAMQCYAENPSRVLWEDNLTLKLHVHFADEEALRCLYHAVADFDISNVSTSNKSSACARVCYVIVHILSDVPHGEVTAPVIHLWRRIFRRVILMLPDPGESHRLPEDTERLVQDCLDLIDAVDVGPRYRSDEWYREKHLAMQQEWKHAFKSAESLFSNHFVFLLSRLLSEEARAEYVQDYWRLQMVEEKYKEDEDAVLKDDEHDDDEGVLERKDGEGGGTKSVEDEGIDGGAQSCLEREAAEQSDLSGLVDELSGCQTSDGTATGVIAPDKALAHAIALPTDVNIAGTNNDAVDHLVSDLTLGHLGGLGLGAPEDKIDDTEVTCL